MRILYYIFSSVVFFLLILSIASAYYKFQVSEDYVVESRVACDPLQESCFVWRCEPESESECTGNPAEEIFYYKIANKNVQNISCNEPGECDFACQQGEQACEEILCAETNKDGVECYTEISSTRE